jgi:hypothetical protein
MLPGFLAQSSVDTGSWSFLLHSLVTISLVGEKSTASRQEEWVAPSSGCQPCDLPGGATSDEKFRFDSQKQPGMRPGLVPSRERTLTSA